MRKKLLFSMAVAVVVCFAVVTATILTGCGNKSTINTVNIYNEIPKYEVGNITDHTLNLEGVEFCYIDKTNTSSTSSRIFLPFDTSESAKKVLEVSKNNAIVVKKTIDGVENYGAYSLKTGSFIFNFKACTSLEILAETDNSTYVSYDITIDGVNKTIVEECGVGVVFELKNNGLSDVEMMNFVVDGKTTYELWGLENEGVTYYEVHKIKGGQRSVILDTRVDAGDPIWLEGVEPMCSITNTFNVKNMYMFFAPEPESNGTIKMNIYNLKKMKKVGSFELLMDDVTGLIMVGNSIIYQIKTELPANSTEYDLFDKNGNLYSLTTKKIDITTGKVAELKNFDYIINQDDEDYECGDGYTVVNAIKIKENKYFNESHSYIKIQLNEEGKVKEVGCYESAFKLSDDRFVLINGNVTRLVDREFNTITDLSSFSDFKFEAIGEMIAMKNDAGKYGIIDKYGKCIVDFKYDDVASVGNGVITLIESKTVDGVTTSHLYKANNKGVLTELLSYSSSDSKHIFMGEQVDGFDYKNNVLITVKIVDEQRIFAFYNSQGEKIGSLADAVGSDNTICVANYGANNEHIAFTLVSNSGAVGVRIVAISTWHNGSLEK